VEHVTGDQLHFWMAAAVVLLFAGKCGERPCTLFVFWAGNGIEILEGGNIVRVAYLVLKASQDKLRPGLVESAQLRIGIRAGPGRYFPRGRHQVGPIVFPALRVSGHVAYGSRAPRSSRLAGAFPPSSLARQFHICSPVVVAPARALLYVFDGASHFVAPALRRMVLVFLCVLRPKHLLRLL